MIYKTLSMLLIGATSLAAVAQQKEMIALAGSQVDKIAIIEKASGKQVFAYDLPKGSECNTIAVTKKGDILFSYKQGVKMIDTKGRTIWDFPVEPGQEAQTARLLDQDKILVGVCAHPKMRLIELSAKDGKPLSEVNYDLGIENPHSQFRQVSKTAAGTYLVPVISQSKVIEINARGEKVGQWEVPSTPFSAKEIENNRLIVGTMAGVVEVDRTGVKPNLVLVYGSIAGTADTLRYGTEVLRLADGGTMFSNWQGYMKNTTHDSQLVELDNQGKVIYTFRDTSIMRNVSGFYLFKK